MIDRVRILIVEDDAALASGIARILEGEGHAVDVMATGDFRVRLQAGKRRAQLVRGIGEEALLVAARFGDLPEQLV